MEISQWNLAWLMLASVLTGVGLGATYDMTAWLPAICGRVFDVSINEKLNNIKLPILNRTLKRRNNQLNTVVRNIGMFLHDFIFMCVTGIVISLLVYRLNDGQWRIGVPICCMVGFAVYRFLLRKVFLVIVEMVCFAIKCVVAYTVYVVVAPTKKIFTKVVEIIKTNADKSRSKRLKRYIARYSENEKRKLLAWAARGCLGININNSKGKEVKCNNDRRKQKKQNNRMDNDITSFGVGNSRDRKSYGIQ